MEHLRYCNTQTFGWVCSMHCQLCNLHHGLAGLRVLASNLAIAAGLCEAFSQGYAQREHEQLYSNHGYRTDQDWRPGCGKEIPMTDDEAVKLARQMIAAYDKRGADHLTGAEKREIGCECDGEIGDSQCNAHPSCAECGAVATNPLDAPAKLARALLAAQARIDAMQGVCDAARAYVTSPGDDGSLFDALLNAVHGKECGFLSIDALAALAAGEG